MPLEGLSFRDLLSTGMRKGENSEARTSLQINEAARLIHSGFGTEWLPASTGVEAGGAVTAACSPRFSSRAGNCAALVYCHDRCCWSVLHGSA